MSSNVVALFEDKHTPILGTGTLANIVEAYTDFAQKQGANVNSVRFLYECATIMTLMQITISSNKE